MTAFNRLITATASPGHASGYVDTDLGPIVPAGKVLVLDFVSTRAEMPPHQRPDPVVVVLDGNGSAVVQHYAVTHFQLHYGGADIYTSAHPLRMRLAADLTLRVDMIRDATNGTARCFFGISGHFEDA